MIVGDQVKLTKAMLGNDIGTLGYVYEEYGINGVSVVFENGSYDGFSEWEQDNFLEFVRHIRQYQNYIFTSVMEVTRDYERGYWAF